MRSNSRIRSRRVTARRYLRGLVRAWPATQAGLESAHSLSTYLKTFYSGHAAPLFEGPASINGRFFYNDTLDGFNFESKRALLGDVLERLAQELGTEVRARPLFGFVRPCRFTFPAFPVPTTSAAWLPRDRCVSRSGSETAPALRRISTISITLPVSSAGAAASRCFRRTRSGNLYVGPLDLTPAGQPVTLVDIRNPDLERFPRFAEAARSRRSRRARARATRSTSPRCGGTTSRRSKTSTCS